MEAQAFLGALANASSLHETKTTQDWVFLNNKKKKKKAFGAVLSAANPEEDLNLSSHSYFSCEVQQANSILCVSLTTSLHLQPWSGGGGERELPAARSD